MAYRIILLSGQVCAGKTTLAKLLSERFGAVHFKSGEALRLIKPGVPVERRALQEAGEALDRETRGQWVRDALMKRLESCELDCVCVLDAVRISEQIDAVRLSYGARVLHVHLAAPREILETRYHLRPAGPIKELKSYDEVVENTTEAEVSRLAARADVLISTERCEPDDVLLRVAAQCGLFGKSYDRCVDVLVGGQWGSEGKGQVSAYLAPEYEVLVRVGGPNAGHCVHMEPSPYTYRLLPSGTRANPKAAIILASGIILDIDVLRREIADCEVDADRLSIDPQAMIATQADKEQEAVEEYQKSFGSTAQGVGVATARRILDRKIDRTKLTIAENVPELKPFLRPVREVLDERFRKGHRVLLEGTQGTGLSLYHGDYPFVTSRDTTVAGCLAEAGVSPSRVRRVVMVCRSYPIRVAGHSGPMGIELTWEEIARRSGVPLEELRKTEKTSTTKRDRRVAEFGWKQLRQAASLNAPTDIALTFVDYLDVRNRDARRVEQLTDDTRRFIEEVERVAMAPVSLMSTRFHSTGIIDRRRW